MTIMIQPMTRRTGGTGTYATYFEATTEAGDVLRALLAGDVLGTSVLTPGAGGAKWSVVTHADATNAQAALTMFMGGGADVTAALVDLTRVDIDRLNRGSTIGSIYTLQDVLADAAAHPDHFKELSA